MLILALLLQAAPADPRQARFEACTAQLDADPAAARAAADAWVGDGGGYLALGCAGLAEAARGNWPAAAGVFEQAARAAEVAHDKRAANYWAQAGNAWLAGDNVPRARAALGAALASGSLEGLALGEAQLDEARALVAAGDLDPARSDIDRALANAPGDPLAWLLSATLARRQGDVPRARRDIAEALRRSPDDASVQLEAGNIAALARDEAGARAAWGEAARLAPNDPRGGAALAALRQFDAAEPAPAPKP